MLSKVIELSGLFLMVDLKAAVEARSIKMVCKENIKDMSKMAESFSCKKLSSACVKFIVEEGVDMEEEDVRQVPAIAAACLKAYKELKQTSKKRKQDSEDYWAFKPTATSCGRKQLQTATSCLRNQEAEEEGRSVNRKRRSTPAPGANKALAAFLKTTGGTANRSQGEQVIGGVVCPFCSRRCSLSLDVNFFYIGFKLLQSKLVSKRTPCLSMATKNHHKNCESPLGTTVAPKIFVFRTMGSKSTEFSRKNHQDPLLIVYFAYGSCKNFIIAQFQAFWGPQDQISGPLGPLKGTTCTFVDAPRTGKSRVRAPECPHLSSTTDGPKLSNSSNNS